MSLSFDFDTEDITKTDHVVMGHDPLVNQGLIMAAVVTLQRKTDAGFKAVTDLNSRLKRIEGLLYGAVGTALIGIIQFIVQLTGKFNGP